MSLEDSHIELSVAQSSRDDTGGFNRRTLPLPQPLSIGEGGKSRRDGRFIVGQTRNDDAAQSRRDKTLLTGGFNRRITSNVCAMESPAGTTLKISAKYRPCGTGSQFTTFTIRRLKSTVNKVMSLRDLAERLVFVHVRRLKSTVNKALSLRDLVFANDTLRLVTKLYILP